MADAKDNNDITFAFFKPDVVKKGQETIDKMFAAVKENGFEVVAQKKLTLSKSLAGKFYAEHNGKPFFDGLVGFMTSGPAIAMILRNNKGDSIKAWRTLLGPTNSLKAKEEAKESLRAQFGTDGQMNACHGSDSPASVAREIGLIFSERRLPKVEKPHVLFVLGGPGAGKGTQCANIVETYGFVHLSAGDLLRAERNTGSANADLINNYIKDGKIVPVEITVNLIKKAMEERIAQGFNFFLVDGFPRNQENFDGWNKVMGDFAVVPFMLFYDCPEAVMIARIETRAKETLAAGGAVRKDDNAESMKLRFQTFVGESMPIINLFEEKGQRKLIDATQSKDEVFTVTQGIINDFLSTLQVGRTFAFCKPDVVKRGDKEVGAFMAAVKEAGFNIVTSKQLTLTKAQAGEFYGEHKGRPFFDGLVGFMTGGPAVAMVLERHNAIKHWRATLGPTNSLKAKEEAKDSLRAKFGTDGQMNAAHGSDSVASANREMKLMFPEHNFSCL